MEAWRKRRAKRTGSGEEVDMADTGQERRVLEGRTVLPPSCWLCVSVSASSSSPAWSLEIKVLKT